MGYSFICTAGSGAGILALPAFVNATRPLWTEWRGEWALISYTVVSATTQGQTNFNAFFRIVGTLLGALVAILVYHISQENPYLLISAGFLFSLPNFWLIVTRPKYATTGRFVLLAYNLTCLYAYNKREVDLQVSSIALRRAIAVCFGTVWAWIVTTCVWSHEARRELRRSLATLLLNSAFLYERLVSAYSTPPESLRTSLQPANPEDGKGTEAGETTFLLFSAAQVDLKKSTDEFTSMELYLQRQLIKVCPSPNSECQNTYLSAMKTSFMIY